MRHCVHEVESMTEPALKQRNPQLTLNLPGVDQEAIAPTRPIHRKVWRANCYLCLVECRIRRIGGQWVMVDEKTGVVHRHSGWETG